MGRNTPNPNLTSLVNCRHILAGAGDVHHAHGTVGQLSGQVCNEGIVLFQAGIGYGAVLQKGNVGMIRNGNFLNVALVLPRLLVFAFGNPFLVPAFQLVARGITPEVYIAFRVQNDTKLVASLQLFHLQRTSAQSSIQLGVALVLSLTQAVYRNGKKVTDYQRETAISMNAPDKYTYYDGGVFTFRGNSFRQNAASGTVEVEDEKLSIEWKYQMGSIRTADYGTWHGIGWTGQPAIIKWAQEARENLMNLYESKRTVKALKEVIFAGLDGKIHFVDLNDGQATRDPINVGYPLKSSVSVNPYGYPMLGVGQAISKLANKRGDYGYYLFNLLDGSELMFMSGKTSKQQDAYCANGAFDGTALFDMNSDTMIVSGENGLIYTIALNTNFDYKSEKPSLTINKDVVFLKTKAKSEDAGMTGAETSVAMYNNYIYTADTQGILQCIDSNTMKAVWAKDVGDNTDAAIALDFDENGDLALYTGNTAYKRLGSKKPVTIRRLNALTGEEIWSYEISCVYNKDQLSGCKASPVVGQNGISGLVIFTVNMTGSANKSTVIALNKMDGTVEWEYELNAAAISSPVAVYNEAGDAWIIQGDQSGNLYLLDGSTGKVCNVLSLGGEIQGSPAVYKDMLVIGTCSKDNAYMYGVRIQ